ncbi:MAG: hypothetical protein N2491_09355 [Negativicutes bacterium]|nr:hypothetical protein [Negativicutes bacterium]
MAAEELHRAILVAQALRFAGVLKTQDWVERSKRKINITRRQLS